MAKTPSSGDWDPMNPHAEEYERDGHMNGQPGEVFGRSIEEGDKPKGILEKILGAGKGGRRGPGHTRGGTKNGQNDN